MEQDVGLLLSCFGVSFVVYHLLALTLGLTLYRENISNLASEYLSNKVLMTGILCTCWFVGYNLVSYAIWSQFESNIPRDAPPDDFVFVDTGEEYKPDDVVANDPSMSQDLSRMSSQTLLITMPSGELVIGMEARSQSAESMAILNS